MILKITGRTSVAEVQEKFAECFPGLELRFYTDFRSMKTASPANSNTLLDDLLKKLDDQEIEIQSWQKCKQIVLNFKLKFGALVRIFRYTNGSLIPLEDDETLVAGRRMHEINHYKPS